MAFEEWMEKRVGRPPYFSIAREIWDEATREERERCIEAARLTAHLGDPCVFCGTPHDEIKSGPCRGHDRHDAIREGDEPIQN